MCVWEREGERANVKLHIDCAVRAFSLNVLCVNYLLLHQAARLLSLHSLHKLWWSYTVCAWMYMIHHLHHSSIVLCTEDFYSAVTAAGLPSMYVHHGWMLQGLPQEASAISINSFFINMTEIILDSAKQIHLIQSQNSALVFHFIFVRRTVSPTISHRDLIWR